MSWFDNVDPVDRGAAPTPQSPNSARRTPPPPAPPAPRRGHLWTVVSSTVLPGGGQAGLTTMVRVVCVLVLLIAALHSGQLGRFVNGLVIWALDLTLPMLIPVVIVLALVSVVLPRLGGAATQFVVVILRALAAVVGTMLGVALRAPLSRAPAPEIPATSLHCRLPDGRTAEVRVAQLCNIAPGSRVSVIGPTLMGRVSAWWVRVYDTDQVIVARGIIPSLVMIGITAVALVMFYR